MPYKCEGSDLMHKTGGSWKLKQKCKSEKNCKSAMRLLYGVENGMVAKKSKDKTGTTELERAMKG